MIPEKIEFKYDPNSAYIENLKVELTSPGSKDGFVDLYVHVKKDIPATADILLEAERQQKDGTFKKFGMPIDINLCDFMKSDKTIVPAILKHSNFSAECPQKAGYYELRNYQMAHADIPFPLPTGEYKITSHINLGTEKVTSYWEIRLVQG